jgi:hypothetical protein
MLPYCNVLTLNVAQQGGVYTLDGTDDRCGATPAASARGLAFLNPNGTIGFGVTMVQPGGVPVHLESTLSLPSLNGTWRDSSGASGNFVLTPGAGIGGPIRAVPTSGVPPGSITAIQLASGAVTGTHVLDGSLTLADISDAPRLVSQEGTLVVMLPHSIDTTVAQVTVTAPAAGRVLVNTSGAFVLPNPTALEGIFCSLTTGAIVIAPISAQANETVMNSAFNAIPFGGTRVFNVAASSTTTFRLLCRSQSSVGGPASVLSPVLTALFVAGS